METTSISWLVKTFEELDSSQIYEILHLRSKIFVVEQKDIYLDADYKDQEALHLIAQHNEEIVAYCRIFKSNTLSQTTASLGRVLVKSEYRNKDIGKQLVQKALEILKHETQIKIAAQLYLLSFYKEFGFETCGEVYLDGTIEHIDMILMP